MPNAKEIFESTLNELGSFLTSEGFKRAGKHFRKRLPNKEVRWSIESQKSRHNTELEGSFTFWIHAEWKHRPASYEDWEPKHTWYGGAGGRIAMRSFIVITALVALAIQVVAGEGQPKVHKYAGVPQMGAYEPPAPTNWVSIPEPARSKIITHLKDRLGVTFYNKLTLVGGQIVDFKALREQEPNSTNYQWEVHAYRLHLRLSLPEDGIEFYDASIECRSDGSVIEEIDLPEIARHPERGKFISTARAFEIAKGKGFDTAKSDVDLAYNTDLGVCAFTFSQLTRRKYPMLYFKRIDIDAHTGKVLKTYDTEAIQ